MKRTPFIYFVFFCCVLLFSRCSSPVNNDGSTGTNDSILKDKFDDVAGSNFFTITVRPAAQQFKMPALHSFASASYGNYWILIGGMKTGFHGTSNNPPPFMSTVANDSIWVVSRMDGRTWGVPVPSKYAYFLSATNMASFQNGNYLNLCGGYTRQGSGSARYDVTSDRFFQISRSEE